ncbi:hypothetical protein K443DRAFT_73249, partial [Laccaria amethystina LaAM-08-1]
EWKIAAQLCDILKVLKDATTFFSCATPHLAKVIPTMDLIDREFTTNSLDKAYEPAICVALNIAKKTLNRYYTKTDQSEVYHIAMILHPHHKLAYFKNNRWTDTWINTVKDIVHAEFDWKYSDLDVE